MTESFLKQIQDRARELDKSATEGIVQFIPPELRRLKPSLGFVQSMFPSTVLREAGGKTKKFFESGGKDYKSGIGALVDTASVGIPLGVFGKLAQKETPKAIEGVTDFFMTPTVKSVDDAIDTSKRAFITKAPVAVAGAVMVPPVLREIGEVIPASGGAKVAKVGLKGALGSAATKAQKLRDLYFGANKVIKEGSSSPMEAVESLSQSMKLGEEMDSVTLSMNKDLDKVLKDAGDFSKFSDDELVAMAEMKLDISHMMRTGKGPNDFVRSGDPLRKEDVSKALDDAIDARGLRKQVRDLGLERMMQSIEAKRSSKPSAGTLDIDLPSDIIPKMLPSSKQATKSIFEPELKRGRQLLIVSCSKDKCPDVGNMKALDRYTGMLFTKMKKAGIPPNVDVAILSAKHGLIRSDTPIEKYDQLMTDEVRDSFLKNPDALKTIRDTMAGDYTKVFVTGGKNYKDVIQAAAGDLDYEVISKKAPGLTQQAVVKKLKEAGDFFHYTDYTEDQIKNFDISFIEKKNRFGTFADILGLHVGGRRSAEERGIYLDPRYGGRLNPDVSAEELKGAFYSLDLDTSKPFKNPYHKSGIWTEDGLEDFIVNEIIDKNPEVVSLKKAKANAPNSEKLSFNDKIDKAEKDALSTFRKGLASRGFTNVPYINAQEDAGSLSHIMLIDRPKGDKVIKSKITAEPMKDGGVAGLSDIARDMFKGPKGIGAYQPFMVG